VSEVRSPHPSRAMDDEGNLADSEDRAHLDLCYEVYNSTFPPPTDTVPVPEASSIAIGRDFYALSANLPAGTRFTWGLNLKFLNLSETLAQARLLADTFQGSRADQLKHVILENVEIGNEPDLYYYSASGFGESWTPHNYSEVWKKHAKAVSEVVNLSTDKTDGIPTLWMGSFTVINMMMVWTPTAVLESGLLDGESGKYASTFCEHHYNGVFGRDRLPGVGELMDKAGVRGNLSLFAESIRVSRASGLDFVLVSKVRPKYC